MATKWSVTIPLVGILNLVFLFYVIRPTPPGSMQYTRLPPPKPYFRKLQNVSVAKRVTSRPTNVLILASMRTGSSFTGQLLGSYEDVFYLFEPGMGLQLELKRKHTEHIIKDTYLNMLRKLFQCDFEKLDFYQQFMLNYRTLLEVAPRLQDVCLRTTKKAKCPITLKMITETCRRSKFIAIKSVRIPDISLLRPLIEHENINLQVIHLVRDPRGMIASRTIAQTKNTLNAVYKNTGKLLSNRAIGLLDSYCAANRDDLEVGMRSQPYRDNYLFVRYEDIALNPQSSAARIYKFLGRNEVPKSVNRWIKDNTNTLKKGMYSTSRVSKHTYQAWRSTLSFAITKEIEKVGQCRDMMVRMGYHLVTDENHLKNMSMSLIGNITVKTSAEDSWWRF